MSEESVLVCIRCADSEPLAESFVDTCTDCQRAVWRAYTSPEVDTVLCATCATARIKAASVKPVFEPPTKEQIEEAKRYFREES
jgi:hypothetical protein